MGKRKRVRQELPEGCHHYEEKHEVPWDIEKYFAQRYDIWSFYDHGVWMTDDAWFGVTPEYIADKIAEHVATAANPSKRFIIDVFAGAGGNAIAFAKTGRWERVIALEKDPQVFHCLLHNARVYGVEDYLSMIQCDSFEMLESSVAKDWQKDSVIFASPPWGGPGYRTDAIFDVSQMQPYSLQQLLDPFKAFTKEIILYLPRTSDVRQIAQYQDGDDKIPVVHYCLKGASKAICVFLGDLPVTVNSIDSSIADEVPAAS